MYVCCRSNLLKFKLCKGLHKVIMIRYTTYIFISYTSIYFFLQCGIVTFTQNITGYHYFMSISLKYLHPVRWHLVDFGLTELHHDNNCLD